MAVDKITIIFVEKVFKVVPKHRMVERHGSASFVCKHYSEVAGKIEWFHSPVPNYFTYINFYHMTQEKMITFSGDNLLGEYFCVEKTNTSCTIDSGKVFLKPKFGEYVLLSIHLLPYIHIMSLYVYSCITFSGGK